MAKIAKKEIYWLPVEGADVMGYRVYAVAQGTPFSYALPFIGSVDASVVAPDDFPAGTFDADITYDIFITAVDDVGNESDPLALSAPFDFVAPNPPTDGGIRDWVA